MCLSVLDKEETRGKAQVSSVNFRTSLDMNHVIQTFFYTFVPVQEKKKKSHFHLETWLKLPQKYYRMILHPAKYWHDISAER